MPLLLDSPRVVRLEIQDEVIAYTFTPGEQFNRGMATLSEKGWKRTKGGNTKRDVSLFVRFFDQNIEKVEGYALMPKEEGGDPIDLMTMENWKTMVPQNDKIAAVGQLMPRESVDDDDLSD